MTSFLKGIFSDKCIVDDRDPLLRFTMPLLVDDTTEFELFAPKFEPWKQLAVFTALQSLLQLVFAALIYTHIIKRRGTIEAYAIGWGIIVPLSLGLPFFLLNLLDVQSKIIRLAASNLMTCVFFRCIEAMYDTSPSVVETSMTNYMAYYSTIVSFVWDTKTQSRKKVTNTKLLFFILEIVIYFVGASLVLSFLLHYNFRPFGGDIFNYGSFGFTRHLLSPEHIANAYFHTLLIYFTLCTGFNLNALNSMLQGYDTKRIFDSPLLWSRTPSEFWTKRWNTMIHQILKTGVFLPLKKFCSTKVSVFLTLVASGLYHEYAWYTMFYNHPSRYQNGFCERCYHHTFGRVTFLFCYFAFLMILERPFANLSPFRWMSKTLPRPIIAHLLVLICLPISFWYYGDWIMGGYFKDFSICVWLIKASGEKL